MLRLRSCTLTQILSSPHASHVSPLHRLLSAAAASGISPAATPGFAAEEYLVSTCGLTRAQAIKASAKLSHLKSPAKPDAVLAFLAGIGLSSADVATAVAKDPLLLCAGVERTLAPVFAGLTGLGLSRSEVARIAVLVPGKLRCRSIVSDLQYYLTIFGSMDDLLRPLKQGYWLLGSDLERVVKPNVAFLRECGLHDCHIAKLCVGHPGILRINQQRLQAMVACAKALCVPHGSGMLAKALQAVAFYDEDKIATKVEHLKKTLRWSDTEVGIALPKAPMVLTYSKDRLQRVSEFLISEVGLEPGYIAHRPAVLAYSLNGRLRPRYYVVKFLKENRLLHRDRDYYSTVMITEKAFVDKFICPHKEAAPHLAEDYAAACRGEVSARFRFT